MTANATDGVTATFDAESRISTATKSGVTTTYVYDSDGNRVKKTNGTNDTLYWFASLGIVAESDLAGTLQSEYVFFKHQRIANRDLNTNSINYFFSDHLKTLGVITDAIGNIKHESDYYPWGGELVFTNALSDAHEFTDKERDTETALDYFGARYYSNGLGRFVTADWSSTPIAVPYADFRSPQSLNLYSYVRNSPETLLDPDGHCCEWLKKIGKAIAGGTYNAMHDVRAVSQAFARAAGWVQKPAGGDAEAAETGNVTVEETYWIPNDKTEEVTGAVAGVVVVAITAEVGGEEEELEALAPVFRTFDEAREEAFENAGMTNPENVTFTRVDPETGTIVEFKGPDGAKVRYDAPHPSPGPAHDQPHVSWQSGGKVSQGGRQRGNIP